MTGAAGRARNWSGLAAAALLALAPRIAAADPPPATTFQNAELRYSVALPTGCRHEEGPGTVDAVCSADLDAARSADANAASSLVLEVSAQAVADDPGVTPADLARSYSEAQFKDELPEAVCGEPDKARVRIANVAQLQEGARVVYKADVACPEIKFLALGERKGQVQVLLAPGARYRLMARALEEDFEKRTEVVGAFFASFRILPAETKSP